MRDNWTDARLDDLNHKVDEGFRRLEADARSLRLEVGGEFKSLRAEMNERFDSLHRLIIQVGGGIVATLIAFALTSHF